MSSSDTGYSMPDTRFSLVRSELKRLKWTKVGFLMLMSSSLFIVRGSYLACRHLRQKRDDSFLLTSQFYILNSNPSTLLRTGFSIVVHIIPNVLKMFNENITFFNTDEHRLFTTDKHGLFTADFADLLFTNGHEYTPKLETRIFTD